MNLIVGTANFGNNYGLTKGKIDITKAQNIINYAKQNHINIIDTAYLYPNSYEILSDIEIGDFQIITKTPKFSHCKNKDEVLDLLQKFIKKTDIIFKLDNIKAILFHDASDLLSQYGDVIYQELKKVTILQNIKIGISIYDIDELIILDKYDLEIVQAPVNIFDQRFISYDVVNFLQRKNIELHVRSIFLQGLLLMNLEKIKNYRPEAIEYIKKLDKVCLDKNIYRLEICLLFIKKIKSISSCLVGINDLNELQEIINYWANNDIYDINFDNLKINDTNIIDPRKWKNK